MAQTVRELMTSDPVTLPTTAKVSDAARLMREHDIGAVIVTSPGGRLRGVVTDRDIVVRAVGQRRDPWTMLLDEICSDRDVATSPPTQPWRMPSPSSGAGGCAASRWSRTDGWWG